MPRRPREEAAPPGGREDPEIERAVRALQAGAGPDAFQPIYDRFYPALLKFFRNRPDLRRQAHDLAQETLLRAHQNIGQFRFESLFKTWLRKIGENVWKNAWRDSRAVKRDADLVPLEVTGEDGEEWSRQLEDATTFRPASPSPEDDVLALERTRLLQAAMEELPPGMRQAVELRMLEDLKYREIADRMGIGLGSVRSQLYEARERLRPLLAEHFDGAEL